MLDLTRGFLPKEDPLPLLSDPFYEWEMTAQELPKLLLSNQLRAFLEKHPAFEVEKLSSEQEYHRAMLLLSYLAHAYVWGEEKSPPYLPAVLAKPWYQVATHLQRPPILSYATYALDNWYRLDDLAPIAVGNIALIQNFLGGMDEEWFILIHVDIEAKAIPAIQSMESLIRAVKNDQLKKVCELLEIVRASLENMCVVLDKMPERCDPYIYYNRVRPYIHGWKNNPALPDGLIYKGVNEYNNQPQQFRGETGAQSAIIPCMDALFGIEHSDDPLKEYLLEMRLYMPRAHREFLNSIEKQSTLRSYVKEKKHAELKDIYNACIMLITRFRSTHLGYASAYIHKQSQTSLANPTQTGTGGTPFMTYLGKHLNEAKHHLL